MAAYAALVSLVNDLDLIPNHQIHSFSFDNKQITSLSQTVNFLIEFMDNYDSQVLESRIACAAHNAHDVIESHLVDQIHAGSTRDGKSRSCFLLDLQKAIDNIDYIDFVMRKAICFEAKSGFKATYSAPAASSEPLTSEKKKNVMVGFEAVVLRLLEMLTGEPSAQQVIPIVGMGGLGKTTLARHVFEHSFIRQHFDLRLWATISQKYSIANILNELLSKNSRNVRELGVQLHQMLWSRRYLIVLDDMWSVEAWDEIQRFLPDNENGSCVIVTTRLSNMAAHLSSSPFEIDFLDYDQSWELFCEKAFGEEGCPIELEEIGKRIVKRCRGLPLSIVVIGGHLKRSSRVIEYWEKVSNFINPISSLGEDEQCLKIISLSYEHLPACLKPCFLYMGIYQEDVRIHATELFRFWIAEGFVKGKKDLSLEEVAEDYLKDLSDRNLILVRDRSWNGKVVKFGIHDIVRELCLKVGEQEKFFGVLDTTKVIHGGRERRIVVPRELSWLQPHAVGALQLPLLQAHTLLRSVLFQQRVWDINDSLFDLRLLRLWACVSQEVYGNVDFLLPTINFHPVNYPQKKIKNHPVNLRSLAFLVESGGLPCPIHSSMSLFWNIQTLIIFNEISVPYEIWEMTQLRHLQFLRGDQLLVDPLPSVMNDQSDQEKCTVLENLHTLLGVRNLRLTEEVCKRMPNIKKLDLSYYDLSGECEASSSSYYCPHNLGRLNKLESLRCVFGGANKWREVVRSLVLPTSLEGLWLQCCYWEDLEKMMKSLPRLGILRLHLIRGPEWDLTKEELEFPRLKTLMIGECRDLINWNANSSHFPVLETLGIIDAPELSEIPFDIGEIPTLGRIHLSWCSVSAAVLATRIVIEQESCGNENLLLIVDFRQIEEVERFQKMVQEECLTTNNLHLSHRDGKIHLSHEEISYALEFLRELGSS